MWAVIIYRKQADEASKSRHLDATRLLLEQIGSDEVRQFRTWLLEESPDLTQPDEDKDRKVRRLVVAYDRVGLMVKQGLLLDRALLGFQRDAIRPIWDKSVPVIDRARAKRGVHYARHFEYLAGEWLRSQEAKSKNL